MLSNNSNAQIKLGIEGGYNMSTFTDKSNNNYLSISTISTAQFGLVSDMNLSKHIVFQTGLYGIEKGGYRATTDFALSGSTTTTKLWYLQLPANLKYQFNVGSKGLQLFAGTGLYVAAGLKGTDKGYYESTSGAISAVDNKVIFTNTRSTAANTTTVKPVDFGYNFFIGTEWKSFQLKANYSKGSSKVFTTGSTNMVNTLYSFTVAYFLKIKK